MDAPTYNLDDEREAAIVTFRLDCFERAGLTSLEATPLALRRDVDRETVERMLSQGATPELVARVLL